MTDEDRIALINDMAANGVALVDDMRFMLAQLAKAHAERDNRSDSWRQSARCLAAGPRGTVKHLSH